MEIPFCLVSDVLCHAQGIHLHEDGLQNLVAFFRLVKLAMGITNLLSLLKNVHPGLSIHLCLSIKGRIFPEAGIPLMKNAKTQTEKKDKNQRKNTPMIQFGFIRRAAIIHLIYHFFKSVQVLP
jgi:hypothetical protein